MYTGRKEPAHSDMREEEQILYSDGRPQHPRLIEDWPVEIPSLVYKCLRL